MGGRLLRELTEYDPSCKKGYLKAIMLGQSIDYEMKEGLMTGLRLEGKVALVTGSSRNIGRAIAITFAREGADVIVNTRSNRTELEVVEQECKSYGVNVVSCLADVSQPDEASRLIQEGLEQLGKIDILVSNVAIRPHKPLLETSDQEWRNVFAVNVDATFYLCKAVLPSMIEKRCGNIIAMGGLANVSGRPNTSAVSASKMALQGLVRVLAGEMAPYGIRANMVMPGIIDTERRYPDWYPELQQGPLLEGLGSVPLGRQGTAQEIANVCLFLASDESSYITGDRILAMGGWQMT